MAGAHSKQLTLMHHQFGELLNLKEWVRRGGGKQKRLAGEVGSVEAAWKGIQGRTSSFAELRRQSPEENKFPHADHRLVWTNRIWKEEASWERFV